MSTIRDFHREINSLVKTGNYKAALSFFKREKTTFTPNEIASNVFIVSDVLKCLRMTKAYTAAGRFLAIYKINIDKNCDNGIIFAWTLTLYDWYKELYKEESKPSYKKSEAIVSEISDLMPLLQIIETEFAQDFYNTIVLKVLKTETKNKDINWTLLARFCESISPEQLHTKCHEMTVEKNNRKKVIQMASIKEEWYSQYSKALYATERYVECITICETAMATINQLHYSNDVWFKRRIAQSYNKLGKLKESQTVYESIIKRKDDWFILSELGDIYKKLAHFEQARETMQEAMLKYGDLNFKIDLIENLGSVYELLGEKGLAKKHFTLAVVIRTKAGWRISEKLRCKSDYNIQAEDLDILHDSLLSKLQKQWSQTSAKNRKEITYAGEIIRIAPPKDAGTDIWIKSENGKNYYAFVRKTDPLYSEIRKGVTVSFQVKPMPDKPLNRAIKIKAEV